MTTNELRNSFNNKYGLGEWPLTYEVDHETYANVCQDIFENQFRLDNLFWDTVEDGEQKPDVEILSIAVGRNKGIMFKNVELILKSREMMK